jgi:hypothetical protein
MPKPIAFARLRRLLRETFVQLPETRTGKNRQYTLEEAAFSAFGVFFTQSPSFLAYQCQMQQSHGHNNARSLFGIEHLPTDEQIRNLLDPVAPEHFREAFWAIWDLVADAGYLADYQFADRWYCSLDGTHYFDSTRLHCSNCSTAVQGETTYYAHALMLPALVRPGKAEILALEPEFITPQDGNEKQDCERQAAKRWITRNAARFAGRQVVVLADDLHCNQPFCQLLVDNRLDFLMTCKPASHPSLYEEVAALGQVGAVEQITDRVWTGKRHEQRTYRFVSHIPLCAEPQALLVNWCEVTIIDEATGKVLYHNTFATNLPVTPDTVCDVVTAGRSRWKIENEGNNVLKNQGYYLEHNYGHGEQNLAMVLVTLLLLAFLCHTVLQLADATYQRIRAALGPRKTFFEDIRALTRYLYFESWEHLLDFMLTQLELAPT